MGDNLRFSASQTGPKQLRERWAADVLGHIVWHSIAIESRLLFFFNSFREYIYIFSLALPGFGQAAERECFTSRHSVLAPKTTSIQCSQMTARWWDGLRSGFELRRNAERRVEEKKNEWVAVAATLHLHQAARSSATMDYGSSWLTHASLTWITLTDTGRMQLSPMSPFCSTSNTNPSVGLTHFGSVADRWRSILSKRIISILRKDAVFRVIILCVLLLLEIGDFCFVSASNSLWLGAVCWKWALNTLMHLVAMSCLLFPSV